MNMTIKKPAPLLMTYELLNSVFYFLETIRYTTTRDSQSLLMRSQLNCPQFFIRDGGVRLRYQINGHSCMDVIVSVWMHLGVT